MLWSFFFFFKANKPEDISGLSILKCSAHPCQRYFLKLIFVVKSVWSWSGHIDLKRIKLLIQ